MENLNNLLIQAGLSNGESRVYLSLLELGESSIGRIISKSGVSSSKVYKILDKLSEKGLVSIVIKNKKKIFTPSNPEILIQNIVRKEKEIIKIKEKLQSKLDFLYEKIKQSKNKSSAEIYEGIDGLKGVFNQSLKELNKKDIMRVIGITKSTEGIRNYFFNYFKKQEKIGFKIKAIFDESSIEKAKERKNKFTEFKFLRDGVITPATIVTYHDKTIIDVGKPNFILTILIKNKEISESFNTYFNLIWKLAKK